MLLKTLGVTAVILCGVFWYTPAVALVTATDKIQLVPASIDTPANAIVVPPAPAVTVPPQLLDTAGGFATTTPVGKLLVKPTPV